MSTQPGVEHFVSDPSLLVELCREVIDAIDVSPEAKEIDENEAQLREISKAIERLEKAGVSVPDVLRGEKTRLVASLAVHAESKQVLIQIADELAALLKDLRERLGLDQEATTLKVKTKRSRAPKTDKAILRQFIVSALIKLGGSAKVGDVLDEMGSQLEGKLLPGDLEWREAANSFVWQNNAQWERYQMTLDGTLRNDSPRGVWELSEDHS